MIKNGKYYVPPQKGDEDFKQLFTRLTSAGAGRPADKNGFPEGQWTPELLANAITQIDTKGSGVELRAVQLWFQENNKGIGSNNIRWLARIFGCDDPKATSEWQIELRAAQSRLSAKRRETHQTVARSAASDTPPIRGISLARRSEAIFGSPLNLPATVFAGAVGLGFSAYFLNIHSVTYNFSGGPTKQVGFLWAPNWTILFMVFMPLFFATVIELVNLWKEEARPMLRAVSDDSWVKKVEASSYTYWAVFLICLGFAGLLQWIGIRLLPLISGGDDYAIDWGSLALVRPEIISVPQAVAFTGFAYLYMCLCFYLFFVGLILLYTLVLDLWEAKNRDHAGSQDVDSEIVSLQIMRGIFRCCILGILIAVCMKLQSFFVTSSGTNIVEWLARDMLSAFNAGEALRDETNYSRPTHYTSLLIAIAACVPFLYASVRLGFGSQHHWAWAKMATVVALLVIGYLLIGSFAGFSVLLFLSVSVAMFGLFDPALGSRCAFRRIRPPIPTTSARLYRGIRPTLTRCREAFGFRYQFSGVPSPV